jgi:hypothetical protein
VLVVKRLDGLALFYDNDRRVGAEKLAMDEV